MEEEGKKWDPTTEEWVEEYPTIAERVNRVRVTRPRGGPSWLVPLAVALLIAAGVASLFGLYLLTRNAGGEETSRPDPTGIDFSDGVTQAQVDKLGDSIQARYESGDTEVAQSLLDNFMTAHPECVSAVIAGGEGKPLAVAKESEQAAEYLKSTAPHPNAYTTVITVPRDEGGVKAAVLGISCE